MDVSMRSPVARLRSQCCLPINGPSSSTSTRPPADVAALELAFLDVQVSPIRLKVNSDALQITSIIIITAFPTANHHHQIDSTISNQHFQHRQAPIPNLAAMNNRRNSMKKDDKQSKPDRKIIRHPTAPFSTKTIIMNLIIAFFLYLLRRVIEAGGKSAITKYSRFIK